MRKSTLYMLAFGLLLAALCQVPLFLLATEINSDEWEKFGSSVVIATITVTGVLTREIWRYATTPRELKDKLRNQHRESRLAGLPVVDDTVNPDDY